MEHSIRLHGETNQERAKEIKGLIGTEVLWVSGRLTIHVRIVNAEIKYGIPRAEIVPVSGGTDTIWVYLDRLVR